MPSSAVARRARPCARSLGLRFSNDCTVLSAPLSTMSVGEPVVMFDQSILTLAFTPGSVTDDNAGSTDAVTLNSACSSPGLTSKSTFTIPLAEAAPPVSSPAFTPPLPSGSENWLNVPLAKVPRVTLPSLFGSPSDAFKLVVISNVEPDDRLTPSTPIPACTADASWVHGGVALGGLHGKCASAVSVIVGPFAPASR